MSMPQKKGKSRVGLTSGNGRQGATPARRQLTRSDDPQLTPPRGTRRYKPRARKCARKGCQTVFTPGAKHGRFCSAKCRKAAARRRKAQTIMPIAEPILAVFECRYCRNTFFAEQGKHAKYCSDSHREMAYRNRREATVQALIGDMGIDALEAVEMVERIGMRRCGRFLRGRGYRYNEVTRRWGVPAEAYVSIDVGQERRHGTGKGGG